MLRALFALFIAFSLFSCSDPVATDNSVPPPPPPPPPADYSFGIITNIDSAGVQHGFGYDIFESGKRIIHQVNIPGEPGNDGFVSEDEAKRVAALVVTKLKSASGFPTITMEELDSLKITLQSH